MEPLIAGFEGWRGNDKSGGSLIDEDDGTIDVAVGSSALVDRAVIRLVAEAYFAPTRMRSPLATRLRLIVRPTGGSCHAQKRSLTVRG